MNFLIAPSERPPITNLGPTSSLPETMGVDIMWEVPGGTAGAQRKTQIDLIASTRGEGGDRLGKELVQMQGLKWACLIIEGTPFWSADGKLANERTSWTLRQQWGLEASIQSQGVCIFRSRSALETCSVCEFLHDRTQNPEHLSSLLNRGGPPKNGWGQVTDKAYAVHVLTGMQGIGVKLAEQLFEKYGRVPCRHDLSLDSLLTIDGIGQKKAASILKVMG